MIYYQNRLYVIIVVIQQVCINGLVSFGSPITNASGSIPRASGSPFVAANWKDLDTSDAGRVYYRSTSSGDDCGEL